VELADTSAWVWSRRRDRPDLRAEFDSLLTDGLVATCDMVRLELLYSARDGEEFVAIRADLEAVPHCPITEAEWRRAISVYGELAQLRGAHQRSVKHPDLLVAAAAEAAGIAVLHHDEDFERVASITGQAHRWLAPPGSLG
jgi:predicted nucleic acid-binding protein